MQKTYYLIISLLFTFICQAQQPCYKSLEEALKQKDCVTCLDLSKQRLKQIPNEVFEFPNLEKLILNKNKIKHIPDSLSTLRNLHYLDLSSNYIDSLPPSLSELSLDTLIMWDNPIYTLPKEFEKWDLKYLDLRAIQMNKDEQKYIKSLFPKARVRMDHPCNCGR
jgi:Leucine-rich repeat (LRR) protein